MPSPTTLSLLPISKSLPKTKPWLSVGLKAAILAVPLFLAAPSEAATVSVNVSGFNGEFAPAEWNRSTVSGSSTNFLNANTTLRLGRNSNVASGNSFANITLDNSLFTSLKSSTPLAGDLISFSYSYDYSWSVNNSTNDNFVFGTTPFPSTTLNTTASTTGTYPSGTILASALPTSLGWEIATTLQQTGVGTGFIDNFSFTAIYDEVPGPLPILGAGAAFGFSRKLRRRLNSAKAVA